MMGATPLSVTPLETPNEPHSEPTPEPIVQPKPPKNKEEAVQEPTRLTSSQETVVILLTQNNQVPPINPTDLIW